jgi:uncharacterized membrane protein
LFGHLRRWFIAGILALLPIGITAWVLVRVFFAIDGTVLPYVSRWVGYQVPGLGFLVTILLVLLVGAFASNFIGRTVIHRFEELFAKLPLISRIYIAVKQIGEGVIGSRKNLFERVVMFEYPRRGSWAMGFVTSKHHGPLESRAEGDWYHVFVPTTPNPTSGFLLFLPATDLVDLDLTVEDGLKLVISGGAVSPDRIGELPRGAVPPQAIRKGEAVPASEGE